MARPFKVVTFLFLNDSEVDLLVVWIIVLLQNPCVLALTNRRSEILLWDVLVDRIANFTFKSLLFACEHNRCFM